MCHRLHLFITAFKPVTKRTWCLLSYALFYGKAGKELACLSATLLRLILNLILPML